MLTAAGARDPDGVADRVEFYLDTNSDGVVEPGVDTLLGDPTLPITQPDGTFIWYHVNTPHDFLLEIDPPLGKSTILARTDADASGMYSNTVATTVTVVPSGVDLTVAGAEISPTTFSQTNPLGSVIMTLNAHVQNLGTNPSHRYLFQALLSQDGKSNFVGLNTFFPYDQLVGSHIRSGLAPGHSRVDTVKYVLPNAVFGSLTPGTYFLEVQIVPLDDVQNTANDTFISDSADVVITF